MKFYGYIGDYEISLIIDKQKKSSQQYSWPEYVTKEVFEKYNKYKNSKKKKNK